MDIYAFMCMYTRGWGSDRAVRLLLLEAGRWVQVVAHLPQLARHREVVRCALLAALQRGFRFFLFWAFEIPGFRFWVEGV